MKRAVVFPVPEGFPYAMETGQKRYVLLEDLLIVQCHAAISSYRHAQPEIWPMFPLPKSRVTSGDQ